jgi:DNA-cytosine methyltransferase
MGLEQAGMTTVFQCEIDKHCQQTLNYHWPEVPKWDDVTTLTGEYILQHTDGIDVVAWGSPCQDLSVAGKRAGLEGERSGLFHHGIRIIKELRELTNEQCPQWSIWENVAGALSSNGGADFGKVLQEMDESGACFSEWRILDAQYFGVPQRRRRVFVVSRFHPSGACDSGCEVSVICESSGGDSTSSESSRENTSRETATGFGNTGFERWNTQSTAVTLSARDYKSPNNVVVEDGNQTFTSSSHAGYVEGVGTLRANGGDIGGERNIVGPLQARDYKGVGNQYVMENKLVVHEVAPRAEQ